MGNERKLRLIQVAKEFKVGLNTITDFLQKKGIKSDGSPNTLVDSETYAVLEKEFGANRAAGNARDSIRERISLKQTTITLEEAKKQEREEEKEVVIKSNVISVKDEIQQPKILGKIDLSPKPKAAPTPAPAPKAEPVKPAEQPRAAQPAPASAPVEAPKPAAKPEPAAEKPAAPEVKTGCGRGDCGADRNRKTGSRGGPRSGRNSGNDSGCGTSCGCSTGTQARTRSAERQYLPPRNRDPDGSAGARHDGRVGIRRRRQA